MPTREGDTYSWPAIMTAKLGSFLVSAGRAREIPAEKREQKYEGTIKARYSDGVWRLKLDELLSDDTNSRSSGGSKTI